MSTTDKDVIVRRGSARWTGTLARGEGKLGTDSGALQDQRYAFATRFGQDIGTNPEELIAAAHAGCYCMALAYALGQAGKPPQAIEATAALSMRLGPQGPDVRGVRLTVRAQVAEIDTETFATLAERAKAECLVSRLLATEVSLEATLVTAST
jgi:osmotically inducible protein OsmC